MIQLKNLTHNYSKESDFMKMIRIITRTSPSKRNLHKVLNKINLEIPDGQILGLIGPNGAGKTTLVKIVAGLLIPTNGEVLVNEEIPSQLSIEFKKSIALFRGNINAMDYGVAVIDAIEEKLAIYKLPKFAENSFVKEFVKHFGANEFLDRTPDSLSLGQRMICEFIYAISHNAKLLILDEPTNGLDVVVLNKFKLALKLLQSKYKCTIILTSHNLQNVLSVSDRIVLINGGKILLDGKPNEVLKQANNEKIIKIETASIPSNFLLPENAIYSAPILELRVNSDNVNSTLKELLEKFEITDIQVEEPSLELIFSKYFQTK